MSWQSSISKDVVREAPSQLARRFWILLIAIMAAAIAASVLAIWLTATPFLRNFQTESVKIKAESIALNLEHVLTQNTQILKLIANQRDVVSVALGYIADTETLYEYATNTELPKEFIHLMLYDALGYRLEAQNISGKHNIDNFSDSEIEALVLTVLEVQAGAQKAVLLKRHDNDINIMVAAPVRSRGLIEGVLLGHLRFGVNEVLVANDSILSVDIIRKDLDDQPFQQSSIYAAQAIVSGTQLLISVEPNMAVIALAGRKLLITTVGAISLVLSVAFATFAWLGRSSIIAPHQKLQDQKNELSDRAAELVIANNQTEFQALHDPLTELFNRRGLDAAFEARKSYGITEGTLIHIDLDHFKNVNDNMGHTAGDFVLSEVGRILSSEVRSRNGDRLPDIVARTGGDEFVVLLGPQATIETAELFSTRLLAKICEPMPFESISLQIGASFGIASTHDGLVSSLSDLLAAADAALYDAKDSGRNCIRYYTESLHGEVVEQRQLALKFRLAISDREFEPYFQPQFDAQTGKLSGVEVLARWPSEQLGLVTPDTFLPIARQLYMMGELDQIIFDKASDQIMTLHRKGIRVPKISFNVTAERVISGGALKAVRSLGKNRPQISIEVLESVIVEDQLDGFWIEIERLRKLEVVIEIDDFGSGHSSLVGALELQPDVLKIDRRLIIPITASEQAKKMLKQIVGMAKIIGLKVTAEGVETIEHAKIATDCGCDILQGFGLALPMPIAELEAFLQNNADLLPSPGTTPHRWTKTSVRST